MRIAGLALLLIGCGNAGDGSLADGGGGGDGPQVLQDGNMGVADLAGGPKSCTPQCSGKSCGDDGCGSVCGGCGTSQLCVAGACQNPSGSDTLNVDPTAGPHAIHPEIYGLAAADAKTLTALNIPLNRWGGNGSTLYNWQLDVGNTANDWFFENIPNSGAIGNPGDANYSSSSDEFIKANSGASAASMITIPVIGWTPKNRITSHPYSCGFPASKYPSQQKFDPYDANCGNGLDASGKNLASDPTDDAMQVQPSFQQQWVQHMVQRFGTATAGGVKFYQLDNETNLWGSTHRDVHPASVTTDEIWSGTQAYAPLIRAADPSSLILGYGTWGPVDLWFSAKDMDAQSNADQMTHGGIPLAQWYLRQLAAYEKANGVRIVDCVDIHYYPQGGDPLENTRSLWDTTYADPSWVNSALGHPVALFPNVQSWIAKEYPGTGICVSEYNFHEGDETNAAAGLVEADVLGLYGVWGVRLAAFWTTPVDGSGNPRPAYRAFQMFRNYDGANGRFLDVSVGATSSNAKLAIYAASDSATSASKLTIIIINKDTAAQTPTLGLQNFTPAGAAKVWQVVNNAAPVKGSDITPSGGKLQLSLPASSITLLSL
jgi:hypothetical protein